MEQTRVFFLTNNQADTLAAAAELEWGNRVDTDPDPSEPERFLSAAQTLRRQRSPEFFDEPDEVTVSVTIPKRVWEWWAETYMDTTGEMASCLVGVAESDVEGPVF